MSEKKVQDFLLTTRANSETSAVPRGRRLHTPSPTGPSSPGIPRGDTLRAVCRAPSAQCDCPIAKPHPRRGLQRRRSCRAFCCRSFEFRAKVGSSDGIERAKRFVHEKDRRISRKSAGQSNALPLATRKLIGISRCELGDRQTYQRQYFFDARLDSCGSHRSSFGTSATFSKTV